MIILCNFMYRWCGYELGGGGSRSHERVSNPTGLKDAIARGAKILEIGEKHLSQTAGTACYYQKVKIDFPEALISLLSKGEFQGLESD